MTAQARHRRRVTQSALIAAVACAGWHARADGNTWDNTSGDAQWSNPSNWVENFEPGLGNSAVFNPGFPNVDSTILLSADELILSLQLNDSYTLSGGDLTVTNGMISTATAGTAPVINSVLAGSGGLSKQGVGTLVLGGANTFTGNVLATVGTLQINSDACLGAAANGVTLNGATLATSGAGTLFTSRTVFIGGSHGTIAPGAGNTFVLNSPLAGVNGSGLTVSGAGTLVLTAPTTKSGPIVVTSGILRVGHSSAVGFSDITVTNSGDLELGDGVTVNRTLQLNDSATLRVDSGSGTYAGHILVGAAANVVLSSGSAGTLTIGDATHSIQEGSGATISIVGPFGGTGSGAVVLSRNTAYQGDWSVNTGRLRLDHANSLGTGASAVNVNNGVLEISGVSLGRNVNLNGGSTLRGTGTAASTGTLTIVNAPANITIATGVTPSDALTIGNAANDLTGGAPGTMITTAGSGTVILAHASNYVGGWRIAGGTLQIGGDDRLGSATNSLFFNGGTLRTSAAVTSARNPFVDSGGGTVDSNGFNSALGHVSGVGAFTKNGAGKLTASQVKIGGALAVNGGTLEVPTNGGASGVLETSSITLAGAAVLAMNDNDFIVDYGELEPSPELALRDHVKAIYQGGTSGISYTVGAGDVALAVAERTEWGFSEFNGVALDTTAVVGKYTYFGDANLDGKVTSDDYVAVDVGLGTGDSWVQGDFNFSGTVTSDDYVAIDVNLGKGSPTPLAFAELKAEMIALHTAMFGDEYVQKLALAEVEGFAALVPEPGAGGAILAACTFLGARRRRACH